MKYILPGDSQNFLEEIRADGIGRLVRGDAQSDGQMNSAAFEFALMIEADAGEGGEQCAVGGEAVIGENYGAALLRRDFP